MCPSSHVHFYIVTHFMKMEIYIPCFCVLPSSFGDDRRHEPGMQCPGKPMLQTLYAMYDHTSGSIPGFFTHNNNNTTTY